MGRNNILRKIIPQGADKSYGIYVAKLAKLPDEVIERAKYILKDLEKNHVYNSVAINGDKENNNIINSNLDEELVKVNQSNFKNKYESLKIEHELIVKDYKHIKKDYDKLNSKFKALNDEVALMKQNDDKEKINQEDSVKEVALTQISFDSVNRDILSEEILNLDILNMTPLDAINSLYNLQRKAKEIKS